MDVERTIEFILEQQARIAVWRAEAEERAARHETEIARLDTELRRVDLRLRRAIHLAVQEARNERRRRREADARFDLKMDQLASAHLLTEEKLDKLSDKIDRLVDQSLRGGNGRPQ